jgi:peptidoglycan/xylan/chitin deacetylase (PgdA/CDA1 family)
VGLPREVVAYSNCMGTNICFHGIGRPGRTLEEGEDPYWVGADQFLRLLDEITTWPSVQISFDDGNASDVEIGLPALLERSLTAQFFVLAGRLDKPGSLRTADVRELGRHGMSVGTHGMHHRSWRRMDAATTRVELVEAREQIADASGTTVDLAACPLGDYDRRLLAALRRQGFRRVYTSDRQPARTGGWLQPRFSVRDVDTPQSLLAQVRAPLRPQRRLRLEATALVKRWR